MLLPPPIAASCLVALAFAKAGLIRPQDRSLSTSDTLSSVDPRVISTEELAIAMAHDVFDSANYAGPVIPDSSTPLVPAHPDTIDPHHHGNLIPSFDQVHLWTEDGATYDHVDYLFAEANITYQFPAVVLPHTKLVSTYTCLSDGLALTFTDTKAYDLVKQEWVGQFVLITTDAHCTPEEATGAHVHWLVSSVSFDDNSETVKVTATELVAEDVHAQVSVIWGRQYPAGQLGGTHFEIGHDDLPRALDARADGDDGSDGSTVDPTTPSDDSTTASSSADASIPTSSGDPSDTSGNGIDDFSSSGNSTGGDDSVSFNELENIDTPYNPNNSTLACINPPDTYMGLPTAPCGEDFDYELDTKIGYFDFEDDEAAQDTFVAGDANITLTRRALEERGFGDFVSNAWKKTSEGVVKGFNEAKDGTVNVAGKVKDQAVNAAKTVGSAAVTGGNIVKTVATTGYEVVTGKPTFRGSFGINQDPIVQVDTPWGSANGITIYSTKEAEKKVALNEGRNGLTRTTEAKFHIYCVNCKAKGHAAIGGELNYQLLPRPQMNKAQVWMNGQLGAQAGLGLVASAKIEEKWAKNIFTKAIPKLGVDIPGVGTVGVSISLDATAVASLSGEVKALYSANLTVPAFDARLDFLNSANSKAANIKVLFDHSFNVSGKIEAKAGLGLPIGIGVGVVVPSAKFDGRIVLKNKPEITASVGVTISNKQEECNGGVLFKAGIADSLVLTIARLDEITLAKFEAEDALGSKCILIPKLGAALPQKPEEDDANNDDDDEDARRSLKRALDQYRNFARQESNDTSNGPDDDFTAEGSTNDTTTDPLALQDPNNNDPETFSGTNCAPGEDNCATDDELNSLPFDFTFLDLDDTYLDDQLLSALNETLANGTRPTLDDFDYVLLTESTGEFAFVDAEDSNFYLVPLDIGVNSTFASYQNIVVGAGDSLMMFFYPEEMKALGVSRWRINEVDLVPQTAEVIALAPMNTDDSDSTAGIYVAIDSEDNVYYPAVCSLNDLESKAFLIADPVAGLETLKQEALQSVVTGGVVIECAILSLKTKDNFAGL